MKFGASIYVGLDQYSLKSNLAYLEFLKAHGIELLFTSAHIPETNKNGRAELEVIINRANELGLKVILDVSKPMFKDFKVPHGIYSLRLDWGFSLDDIIELVKGDYLIDLNASTVTEEHLLYLQAKGVDFSKLRASHNFYPKPYTALSYQPVITTNKILKAFALPILIFIPSMAGRRPPLGEGLPTIEAHRHLDIHAILSEMQFLGIDEVCFGDAYCNEIELEATQNYQNKQIIVPIKVFKGISELELDILMREQVQRADVNEYFVRSSIREPKAILPFNTIKRSKKMITIDNSNFLRYQGEVGIMKLDLDADARVNVVGKAEISDFLLQAIKPRQKFTFKIVGEINEQSNNIG